MASLTQAFAAASPRLAPRRTPLASLLIHGGVLLLWAVLFARVFVRTGVLAWSVGIAYVGYDTGLLLFVAWQMLALLRVRPASAGAGKARPRPTLGVIIAACNEAKVLPVTLIALGAQSDPPDVILIADDGSTDDTLAVLAARFGLTRPAIGEVSAPSPSHPAIRWLRLAHGGKATALNAALPRVGTDIVVTVDADTGLAHDALAAMRRAFASEPELVAATGVLVPRCTQNASGRIFEWFQTYEYIRNFLTRYAWMQADGLLLISGAFAGMRREAVLRVGGFDAACFTEDYELIHRLRRHAADHSLDWRVRVIGGAVAETDAPGNVTAFLRQRRRWFGGFLQTQYWYRDMAGNRRYGRVGTLMLPVKAIDTLQPLYGLTAAGLLLYFVAAGRIGDLLPAFGVVAGKIGVDLSFHLGSVFVYRRWIGADARRGPGVGPALLAALVEPFSFQLLRHAGAAWGWVAFVTRGETWTAQRRAGRIPASGE